MKRIFALLALLLGLWNAHRCGATETESLGMQILPAPGAMAIDARFVPRPGFALRGDFGATHGNPAAQRTRLRTDWANQHTGIVDDAVYELMMEPSH